MLKLTYYVIAAASAIVMPAAQAADKLGGLEMDVMSAGETPTQATARISLPAPAAAAGVEHSRNGLQTANDARDNGQEIAEQARDGRGASNAAAGGGQGAAGQAHQIRQPVTVPAHSGRP